MGLKIALFRSPLLTAANRVPVDEFTRIAQDSEFAAIRSQIGGCQDLILQEVCDREGLVDLNAFSDLVDLFVYFPSKQKTTQRQSDDIYAALKSNAATPIDTDPSLRNGLDLIGERLKQKFHSFAEAFRFFDKTLKNQVYFTDFAFALD